MEVAITVFALIFLFFTAFGIYVTTRAVRAAKRGVDRTISQARRTVEDRTLRARSFAQPGPAGELAQLRLSLRTSMRATQEALHAGSAEDESLRESLALFERLSRHGQELDVELRHLESEPDRATLGSRLPTLRSRTERITRSADALRWAARDRAHRFADDDLDSLSAQIDVEAGALRHWTTATPAGTATPGPADEWPQAPAADGPDAQQTWPGTGAAGSFRTGEEPTRPQVAPPRRTSYPWQAWQKKPRPESTT